MWTKNVNELVSYIHKCLKIKSTIQSSGSKPKKQQSHKMKHEPLQNKQEGATLFLV